MEFELKTCSYGLLCHLDAITWALLASPSLGTFGVATCEDKTLKR